MSRITQQTWDQLGTQLLAGAGLVITIGNEAGWWAIGSDLQQNIIGLGTVILGLLASLLYTMNSTPNRVVDRMVAMAKGGEYQRGYVEGRAVGEVAGHAEMARQVGRPVGMPQPMRDDKGGV